MTNSKEALQLLSECANGETKLVFTQCLDLEKTIKQDLDRLEELEKEHNKLKERYKHRAETSNDLCKEVRQYEKAFEILNDKFELFIFEVDNIHYIGNEYAVGQLSQEQYELLIERGVRKC